MYLYVMCTSKFSGFPRKICTISSYVSWLKRFHVFKISLSILFRLEFVSRDSSCSYLVVIWWVSWLVFVFFLFYRRKGSLVVVFFVWLVGGVESDAPEVFLSNLEAAVWVPGGTGVLDPDGVLVLKISEFISKIHW